MKPRKALPPIEFLRQMFRYVPETGELLWSDSQPNLRWKGKPAGCKRYQSHDGSPQGIRINAIYDLEKATFYVHHVVAALHGIEVPQNMVLDHKDGNPFNNRIENLRVATNGQNIANARRRRDSPETAMLPKGVHVQRGKFIAKMGHNGQQIYLGTFRSAEEAHEAYCKKAKEIHGEFFRAQ